MSDVDVDKVFSGKNSIKTPNKAILIDEEEEKHNPSISKEKYGHRNEGNSRKREKGQEHSKGSKRDHYGRVQRQSYENNEREDFHHSKAKFEKQTRDLYEAGPSDFKLNPNNFQDQSPEKGFARNDEKEGNEPWRNFNTGKQRFSRNNGFEKETNESKSKQGKYGPFEKRNKAPDMRQGIADERNPRFRRGSPHRLDNGKNDKNYHESAKMASFMEVVETYQLKTSQSITHSRHHVISSHNNAAHKEESGYKKPLVPFNFSNKNPEFNERNSSMDLLHNNQPQLPTRREIKAIEEGKTQDSQKGTKGKSIVQLRGPLDRLSFVVIGSFQMLSNEKIQKLITNNCGKVVKSVLASTNFVVYGSSVETGGSIEEEKEWKKAKEIGIPLLDEKSFCEFIQTITNRSIYDNLTMAPIVAPDQSNDQRLREPNFKKNESHFSGNPQGPINNPSDVIVLKEEKETTQKPSEIFEIPNDKKFFEELINFEKDVSMNEEKRIRNDQASYQSPPPQQKGTLELIPSIRTKPNDQNAPRNSYPNPSKNIFCQEAFDPQKHMNYKKPDSSWPKSNEIGLNLKRLDAFPGYNVQNNQETMRSEMPQAPVKTSIHPESNSSLLPINPNAFLVFNQTPQIEFSSAPLLQIQMQNQKIPPNDLARNPNGLNKNSSVNETQPKETKDIVMIDEEKSHPQPQEEKTKRLFTLEKEKKMTQEPVSSVQNPKESKPGPEIEKTSSSFQVSEEIEDFFEDPFASEAPINFPKVSLAQDPKTNAQKLSNGTIFDSKALRNSGNTNPQPEDNGKTSMIAESRDSSKDPDKKKNIRFNENSSLFSFKTSKVEGGAIGEKRQSQILEQQFSQAKFGLDDSFGSDDFELEEKKTGAEIQKERSRTGGPEQRKETSQKTKNGARTSQKNEKTKSSFFDAEFEGKTKKTKTNLNSTFFGNEQKPSLWSPAEIKPEGTEEPLFYDDDEIVLKKEKRISLSSLFQDKLRDGKDQLDARSQTEMQEEDDDFFEKKTQQSGQFHNGQNWSKQNGENEKNKMGEETQSNKNQKVAKRSELFFAPAPKEPKPLKSKDKIKRQEEQMEKRKFSLSEEKILNTKQILSENDPKKDSLLDFLGLDSQNNTTLSQGMGLEAALSSESILGMKNDLKPKKLLDENMMSSITNSFEMDEEPKESKDSPKTGNRPTQPLKKNRPLPIPTLSMLTALDFCPEIDPFNEEDENKKNQEGSFLMKSPFKKTLPLPQTPIIPKSPMGSHLAPPKRSFETGTSNPLKQNSMSFDHLATASKNPNQISEREPGARNDFGYQNQMGNKPTSIFELGTPQQMTETKNQANGFQARPEMPRQKPKDEPIKPEIQQKTVSYGGYLLFPNSMKSCPPLPEPPKPNFRKQEPSTNKSDFDSLFSKALRGDDIPGSIVGKTASDKTQQRPKSPAEMSEALIFEENNSMVVKSNKDSRQFYGNQGEDLLFGKSFDNSSTKSGQNSFSSPFQATMSNEKPDSKAIFWKDPSVSIFGEPKTSERNSFGFPENGQLQSRENFGKNNLIPSTHPQSLEPPQGHKMDQISPQNMRFYDKSRGMSSEQTGPANFPMNHNQSEAFQNNRSDFAQNSMGYEKTMFNEFQNFNENAGGKYPSNQTYRTDEKRNQSFGSSAQNCSNPNSLDQREKRFGENPPNPNNMNPGFRYESDPRNAYQGPQSKPPNQNQNHYPPNSYQNYYENYSEPQKQPSTPLNYQNNFYQRPQEPPVQTFNELAQRNQRGTSPHVAPSYQGKEDFEKLPLIPPNLSYQCFQQGPGYQNQQNPNSTASYGDYNQQNQGPSSFYNSSTNKNQQFGGQVSRPFNGNEMNINQGYPQQMGNGYNQNFIQYYNDPAKGSLNQSNQSKFALLRPSDANQSNDPNVICYPEKLMGDQKWKDPQFCGGNIPGQQRKTPASLKEPEVCMKAPKDNSGRLPSSNQFFGAGNPNQGPSAPINRMSFPQTPIPHPVGGYLPQTNMNPLPHGNMNPLPNANMNPLPNGSMNSLPQPNMNSLSHGNVNSKAQYNTSLYSAPQAQDYRFNGSNHEKQTYQGNQTAQNQHYPNQASSSFGAYGSNTPYQNKQPVPLPQYPMQSNPEYAPRVNQQQNRNQTFGKTAASIGRNNPTSMTSIQNNSFNSSALRSANNSTTYANQSSRLATETNPTHSAIVPNSATGGNSAANQPTRPPPSGASSNQFNFSDGGDNRLFSIDLPFSNHSSAPNNDAQNPASKTLSQKQIGSYKSIPDRDSQKKQQTNQDFQETSKQPSQVHKMELEAPATTINAPNPNSVHESQKKNQESTRNESKGSLTDSTGKNQCPEHQKPQQESIFKMQSPKKTKMQTEGTTNNTETMEKTKEASSLPVNQDKGKAGESGMDLAGFRMPPIKPIINPTSSQNGRLLWCEKYSPTDLRYLPIAGPVLDALLTWLQDWHRVQTLGQKKQLSFTSFQGSGNGTINLNYNAKAALLSGPPGIGKTTSVRLIAKKLGYELIERNASDVRTKSSLRCIMHELTKNKTISTMNESLAMRKITKSFDSFGNLVTEERPGQLSKKTLVLMDEVDGMNTDTGGVSALISEIKSSEIPIICICNDRQHQKMRALSKHCIDLKFALPKKEYVVRLVKGITDNEGVDIDFETIDFLSEANNCDIRQMINHLEIFSRAGRKMTVENANQMRRVSVKDAGIMMSNYTAVCKFLNRFDVLTHLFALFLVVSDCENETF